MKILINDFIGGALDRGIPLYVRNLIDGLQREGFQVGVVRAPAWCRKLPRSLFYLIAVVVEQTALPLIGLFRRAELTIYPYNSVAILDVLSGRGRMVIHDLEQLNRPLSFSKLYYLACYRVVKWRDAPFFAISGITQLRLIRSNLLGHGQITLLPNTFYAFERLLAAPAPPRKPAILLCTGSTANKDLDTLVQHHLPKLLNERHHVSIFGLHKKTDMMRLEPLRGFLNSGQLRLCGLLSDEAVAREYRSHTIVWVHSLREGFGRCVVEGRLAGGRVIASNIPEFAGLRDGEVYLYNDAAGFMTTLQRVAAIAAPAQPYTAYPYRELLHTAIARGIDVKKAQAASQ